MMIIAIIVHNAKIINENVTERPIIVLFPERTLLKAFEVAIIFIKNKLILRHLYTNTHHLKGHPLELLAKQ